MPIDQPPAESALLIGGPAHGIRVRVTGRPNVIQVTWPCEVETPRSGVRAAALAIYRREAGESDGLRYGFDPASP